MTTHNHIMMFLAGACFSLLSCGYKPLRTSLQGSPRIRVERAVVRAPQGESNAAGEAEGGARAELAKWGALASGDDGKADRLTVELVRIDERSEGESVVPGAFGDKPLARGVRVRITARGDVEGEGGAFTTPDVDVTETVATNGVDALTWDAARQAAIRTAARKAGALVARDVLGIP